MFKAPIPGQSLTTEPKKYPYERPPEIADPEEALKFHLQRLGKDDKKEAIVDMLELDVDVVSLTEGILRAGVAAGIHSIDTSLTIGPVIHKYIKKLADDAGIEYEEGLVDKEAEERDRKAIAKAKAYKKVSKRMSAKEEPEEEIFEEEPMAAEEPTGLVQRRNV